MISLASPVDPSRCVVYCTIGNGKAITHYYQWTGRGPVGVVARDDGEDIGEGSPRAASGSIGIVGWVIWLLGGDYLLVIPTCTSHVYCTIGNGKAITHYCQWKRSSWWGCGWRQWCGCSRRWRGYWRGFPLGQLLDL